MRGELKRKPHAVCVPFPAQGHVDPMLQLAKLLHHSGFHITFVHTVYNYRRLLRSGGPASLDGLPDFRFETIPDGLPLSEGDVTQDIPSLVDSIPKACQAPFTELMNKLRDDSDHPPPSCVVSDNAMWFTVQVAEEFGVPFVSFRTTSACGFLGIAHFPGLIESGAIPLKDKSDLTNGYLDKQVEFIPGKESIRLRDFPSFVRTTNPDDKALQYILESLERTSRASTIILNTFDALEHDVLNELSLKYPKILSIGPLGLLVDHIPKSSPLHSIRSSLWKEEPECIKWLSSRNPHSVIYVNFGSITVLSKKQLVEFAWGLANSQQSFLWIIRPDLVAGETAILPFEFMEETRDRGLLAEWCPQKQVLNHPSVGGFLTHCGWNSTIESISAGVPMICWPFFAEQHTNCWFSCNKWGVGMEIDSDVKRDGVEKLARKVMAYNKGHDMHQKAMEWKKLAEEAVSPSGSSSLNFNKLVNEVLGAMSSTIPAGLIL